MIISLESTPDNILRPYLDESICKPGETREWREESDGIQPADELNKKTLALVKNEQLEELKLSKFNGKGRQRYLNYYRFYQEFDKLVMQKPYSDSSKLSYLKQYLEEDALDIVKNYDVGSELAIAFKALDDEYGRGETIMHILAQEGCLETLQKILRVKERPVIDESRLVDALLIYDNAGWSPLMAAVKSDRNVDDVIQLFLRFLEKHATTEDIKELIGKPQVIHNINLLNRFLFFSY